MLVSIKKLNQAGTTIVELLVVVGICSVLFVSFITVSLYMYGDTLRASQHSSLASESQSILRSVVDELRLSSSIRTSNANPDSNAPGGTWTTSNDNLILIISTPALDSDNNFIMNQSTGFPYQNEIVYYAIGQTLFKRQIADPNAPNNSTRTTCPPNNSGSSCPSDVEMSKNFQDLSFIFYDQDDAVTNNLTAARSIRLNINLGRTTFGQPVTFENAMRVTIRNTAS